MQNQVAQTILAQLGGNRFLVMTGAKNLVASENALMMSLPANLCKDRANKLRITLEPSDTYKVEVMKYSPRTFACDVLNVCDMVYADNLQEVFTSLTGLDTRI